MIRDSVDMLPHDSFGSDKPRAVENFGSDAARAAILANDIGSFSFPICGKRKRVYLSIRKAKHNKFDIPALTTDLEARGGGGGGAFKERYDTTLLWNSRWRRMFQLRVSFAWGCLKRYTRGPVSTMTRGRKGPSERCRLPGRAVMRDDVFTCRWAERITPPNAPRVAYYQRGV
ncbi:unnamed protein product, partial [Iphiclides podalirius]